MPRSHRLASPSTRWLVLTALSCVFGAGCSDDPPRATAAAGSGAAGGGGGAANGGGGAGGGVCGSTPPTSGDDNFVKLVQFAEEWRLQKGIVGMALAVAHRGGEPQIATFGTREPGTCDAVTEATRFREFTGSHLATALATLAAIDQGDFALGTPAVELVPEFAVVDSSPHGTTADVTIGDLLRETSGLPSGFFGFIAGEACLGDGSLTAYFEQNPEFELWYPPGRHWGRGSIPRTLLGRALENNAGGQEFANVIDNLVFEPLALNASYDRDEIEQSDHAVDDPDPTTTFTECAAHRPGSGLSLDIRDSLRLLQTFANRDLVSAETWASAYDVPRPRMAPYGPPTGPFDGVVLPSGREVLIPFAGHLLVPEDDFVVTVLVNASAAIHPQPIVEKAVELYLGETVEPYEIPSDPASWDAYVGDYHDPVGGRTARVSIVGEGLTVEFVTDGVVDNVWNLAPSSPWLWVQGAIATSVEPGFFGIPNQNIRFWPDEAGGRPMFGSHFGQAGPHFLPVAEAQP